MSEQQWQTTVWVTTEPEQSATPMTLYGETLAAVQASVRAWLQAHAVRSIRTRPHGTSRDSRSLGSEAYIKEAPDQPRTIPSDRGPTPVHLRSAYSYTPDEVAAKPWVFAEGMGRRYTADEMADSLMGRLFITKGPSYTSGLVENGEVIHHRVCAMHTERHEEHVNDRLAQGWVLLDRQVSADPYIGSRDITYVLVHEDALAMTLLNV